VAKITGFMEYPRQTPTRRPIPERVHDWLEVYEDFPVTKLKEQAARCMDCGIPFCHQGCPVGNIIPDWNDLVYRNQWHDAIDRLHATNNFPEFTGLICPAPCESACVLDINSDPVTIEQIELAIVTRGFDEGWIDADPPEARTGTTVGVVGSGPAGLAVAAELNKLGHAVTVYERDEAPGGLLRFGVPDAKLEKWIIDRRADVLADEGVVFECDIDVGRDVSAAELRERHDALVIAIGSRVHRDLEVPGRDLPGVHFAMDYLYQRNRAVARMEGRPARDPEQVISAADKHVIVVGGGDTGMDCISNSIREGATDVQMLDVYPELPPSGRHETTPWPLAPKRTPTTYALDEGGKREWNAEVIGVEGDGKVERVRARKVEGTSSRDLRPVPGSEFELPADLVLVAIGFSHPEHDGPVDELGLDKDARGNVKAPVYAASAEGVFACGDARVGQSLVVTAIAEGRKCARLVDRYLGGHAEAPRPDDPEAHFIEHAAETAGTVTMQHQLPGER
jgi:glutamate synthase (NADPH) small chain